MRTYRTRALANAGAKQTLNQLITKGWKKDIDKSHDGWRYILHRNGLSLYEDEDGRYTTLLGSSSGCGSLYWRYKRSMKSPNQAVDYQYKVAMKFITQKVRLIYQAFPERINRGIY